jgi:cytochrome d ubiquinol oxidase subunit I
MNLDVLLLSRLQFAITIGFHFLFPPISIGLAWLLVFMEWMGWKKDSEVWRQAGKFFARILALTFAVGVATGIVMEFQFGTNWAEYSKFVGDIFGAPLAAEGVFAFFLESTFLGLYLFGRNKVSKGIHWFSIFMVAFGASISAFWILVANSWQQTPAGFVVQNGRAELTSFAEAVFNPSMWLRFHHTMTACMVAGAFMVIGVSAYLILKKKDVEVGKKTLKLGLIVGLIVTIWAASPSGHGHAVQVAATQPEKLATMEGIFEGTTNAPLTAFGIPTNEPRDIKMQIAIPGMLSWLISGDTNTYVKGMKDFEAEGWPLPPFAITFTAFHIMITLGGLFILITTIGVFLMVRRKLYDAKWYLRILPWAVPLPLIAIEFGWILAEVGRQPWIVYRVMKTADAFSFNVSGGEVLFSMIVFSLIYLLLFGLYMVTLFKIIQAGPKAATGGH